MRVRKKKWAENELLTNPRIIRDISAISGKAPACFGNGKPIHAELGCGKGQFIALSAKKNADINYIGIERDPTILAAAARLSADLGDPSASDHDDPFIIGNLVFMELDARDLESVFSLGDIKRLYINFCDPWHRKKKWAKRRLTHENFIVIYERLQIPEVYLKTDNRVLFDFSVESFASKGWVLRNISYDLHQSAYVGNIMTEYEEKFASQNLPIYRLEAYNASVIDTALKP